MQTVKEQLFADLYANPNDWRMRNVVFDWYEDNGCPDEAACLTWMLENRKRPYSSGTDSVASWFNGGKIQSDLGDGESDLPEEVYNLLENYSSTRANHRTYASVQAAEEAFVIAWIKWKKK